MCCEHNFNNQLDCCHRHSLVFTPQTAPMQEFLILAALQRVWALGLAGPEAGMDEHAQAIQHIDAAEHSVW